MKTFINDRRITKRYDIPLKLTYCVASANCHGETLTKNICSTGLRFPVNTKIPKNTLLDLRIEDPYGNMQIASKAKVIWLGKEDAEDITYEIGVKLLKKRLY